MRKRSRPVPPHERGSTGLQPSLQRFQGRWVYAHAPAYAHGDAFPQIVRCAIYQVLANSILPPSLPWQTMGSDGTDADQLNRGAYVHPTDEGVTGHASEVRHWDGETMDTFWGLAIYEGGVFWLQDPHPCGPPPDYMVNGVPVCVRPSLEPPPHQTAP